MRIITGNLWNTKADYIFVTGNSYVDKTGKVVMGRGAALEARNKFPFISKIFGDHIMDTCGNLGVYGIIPPVMHKDFGIGLFQVKRHFIYPAELDIIRHSTNALISFITSVPGHTVAMNFPGIGNGKRTMEEVLPIISILPDCVTVYCKENNEHQ